MTKLSNGISRMKETFEAMKSKAVITPKKVLSILLSGLLACTLMLPSTQLAWADTPATDQNEQQSADDANDVASASAGAPVVPDHSLDTAAFSGDYTTNAHWALYDSGEKTSDNKTLYDLVISRKDPTQEASVNQANPWTGKSGGKEYIRTVKVGAVGAKVSFTIAKQLFSGYTAVTAYDLSGMDTSSCASFSEMFQNNSSLTELDITPLTFNPKMVSFTSWTSAGASPLVRMFNGCEKLEKIEGLDNISEEYWAAAVKSNDAKDLNGNINGGLLKSMFAKTSILSIDVSRASTEYGYNAYPSSEARCCDTMFDDAAVTKVVLGKKMREMGPTNANGPLPMPFPVSQGYYWTPEGDSSTKLDTHAKFWDYQMAHGYGKSNVTYVRWIQPTFNARGGTWDPSVNQGRTGEGEKLSGEVYTGVAFQMYNGEQDSPEGKVVDDPTKYVSYGSRHFLGWFDTDADAKAAESAAAKDPAAGKDPTQLKGYVELSRRASFQYTDPHRWEDGNLYAAWSTNIADVPVCNEDGSVLPVEYDRSTGKASGAAVAKGMDNSTDNSLFKGITSATPAIDPDWLTVTDADAANGEKISGVKVTGNANDWKIQIPNNERGYAPLRATVTVQDEDNPRDGMNDKATIKVTYPVMATVVDASGNAITPADNSGDMDPDTNGVQVLVDPQALVKGKDGNGSYKFEKGDNGYTITISNLPGKAPVKVAIQNAIDKTPADGNQEYVPGKIPENTPFEEVWLDPTYLGQATIRIKTSNEPYDGQPVDFSNTIDIQPSDYEGDTTLKYEVQKDGTWEPLGEGKFPTNAGHYRVTIQSTPKDPNTWATPHFFYDGTGEEFDISKIDVYFKVNSLTEEHDGKVAYTGKPVSLPEGWNDARDQYKTTSDGAYSYEWQVKGEDGNYTKYGDGEHGTPPSDPGSYRLHREVAEGTNWNANTEGNIDFIIEQTQAPEFTLTDVSDYTYNGSVPAKPDVNQNNVASVGSSKAQVSFTWQQSDGHGGWTNLESAPTDKGDYRCVATLTKGEGELDPIVTETNGWTKENNSYVNKFKINPAPVTLQGDKQSKEWNGKSATFDLKQVSAELNTTWKGDGSKPVPEIQQDQILEWYAADDTNHEHALKEAPSDVGKYQVKVSWTEGVGWDAGFGFVDYEITKSAAESGTFTIHYDSNAPAGSVSGMPEDQTVKIGLTGQTLSSQTPSMSGYSFKGWMADGSDKLYQPGASIEGALVQEAGQTLTLYAQWERNDADVTYKFVSGTKGHELPEQVTSLEIPDSVSLPEGSVIAAPTTTYEPIADGLGGTWTFKGWSPNTEQTLGKDGVTFTGTWEWTENTRYPIHYDFAISEGESESGAPKELPESVLSLLDGIEPSNAPEGAPVAAPTTTFKSVKDGEGTWSFIKWSPDASAVMTKDGLDFTGYWKWSKNPAHDVTYKFVSGTDGKDLPESVTKLCPEATSAHEGAQVTPPTLGTTAVADGMGGKWTFTGWAPESQTMEQTPISFTGTWVWSENNPANIDFKFGIDPTSDEGAPSELPQGVTDQLPQTTQAPIDSSYVPSSGFTSVKDGTGTWYFQGWNPLSGKVTEEGLHFKGLWKWVKDEPESVEGPHGVVDEDGNKVPTTGDELPGKVEPDWTLEGPEGTHVDENGNIVVPNDNNGNSPTSVKVTVEDTDKDGVVDTITVTPTYPKPGSGSEPGSNPQPGPNSGDNNNPPVEGEIVLPGSDNTPNTDDDVTVVIPGGSHENEDGTITIPSGEETILPGPDNMPGTNDDIVVIPNGDGGILHPNGDITLPDGGKVIYPGGGVYDLPNGSVVHPDGSITLPDGATLSFDNAKASATMPKTGDYTQGIIYGLIGTALLSLIVMVVVRKTSKRKV